MLRHCLSYCSIVVPKLHDQGNLSKETGAHGGRISDHHGGEQGGRQADMIVEQYMRIYIMRRQTVSGMAFETSKLTDS